MKKVTLQFVTAFGIAFTYAVLTIYGYIKFGNNASIGILVSFTMLGIMIGIIGVAFYICRKRGEI